MRSCFICLVLLVACGANEQTQEENSVRQLLEKIIAADNRSDITTVLSCYAHDAVLMPANKPAIAGIAAIDQNYRAIFSFSSLHLETQVAEIVISGSWASVAGSNTGKVMIKKDSSIVNVDDKFMMLLEKQSGGWKIRRLIWNKNQP